MERLLFPGPVDGDWPLYGLVDDVRPALSHLLTTGGALATLIGVDGPSPRPIGAQMAIAPDGRVAGYVSGGCVEGAVAEIGREVAEAGAARRVVFGKGSPFSDISLVCGTRIEVLVEPLAPGDPTIAAVLAAAAARRAAVRWVGADGKAWIAEDDGAGRLAGEEGGRVFRRYEPRLRLVMIGRDPVALAAAKAAGLADIEAVLVRRLGPPTPPEGFAGRYIADEVAPALARLGLDAWTAVVSTTHDLEEDHDALACALPSPAFYVGALGSRRRLADRIDKLVRSGIPWERARRLHSPVGLDIGAATPGEIAIAVIADVIRARRAGGRDV